MIALTEQEIENCVKVKGENIDYGQAFNLLEQIAETVKPGEGSLIDKIVWIVRCAYLVGFEQGLRGYNSVVKEQED